MPLGQAGTARGTGGPESGAVTKASASGLEEKQDQVMGRWGGEVSELRARGWSASKAHPLSSQHE